MTLPANLPSIANAKLPQTYERAKATLAECHRLDECADWANKAEALASYAKQAGDDSLRKTADRIQARAINRCGELLRAITPAKNQHPEPARGGAPPSRSQAARDAGLSRDQKRDALRVARIPRDEFEAAVESDNPPTVTALAAQGKVSKPLVDLGGRDPKEYAAATHAQGELRRCAKMAAVVTPAAVLRGSKPHELVPMRRHAERIAEWVGGLLRAMKEMR